MKEWQSSWGRTSAKMFYQAESINDTRVGRGGKGLRGWPPLWFPGAAGTKNI